MVKPITQNGERDLLEYLTKTLLFEGFVAGYRHYTEKDTLWEIMRQPIKLVRNAANEYDENATAVFAGNKMIGYVPQSISPVIANKLDSGDEIQAELVHVNPSARDQEKVQFKIWCYKEEE